ncbi:farnesyltransferase, CAAX box, beta-like protein [Gorgonomyces haynaldii]|nr:farnesyltransferase, CAAX box, beta-like protein [Gorgonomyces haynaldii]
MNAKRRQLDDNYRTQTSIDQDYVEDNCDYLFSKPIEFYNEKHIKFSLKAFDGLNFHYQSLDASKPWIIYWNLHALGLLGHSLSDELKQRAVASIDACQSLDGGYSGGHGQLSHLATTYAAIHGLCAIGTQEAYESINTQKLYQFLMKMKQEDGSFTMHEGGEIDVRGSYCALSVAALLGISTPELEQNCASFISECQTFEGGLSGYPDVEAHGGYTFCALGALTLLDQVNVLNVPKLEHWFVSRQMQFEGGFQGRTNKLVDGCYSFWQGGTGILLELERSKKKRHQLFDRGIPIDDNEEGGLRDKPEKRPDFYHTCYVLSGLSLAHHEYFYDKTICAEKSKAAMDMHVLVCLLTRGANTSGA